MATQAQLFSSSLMQPATAATDGSIPAVVPDGNRLAKLGKVIPLRVKPLTKGAIKKLPFRFWKRSTPWFPTYRTSAM